MKYFINFIKNDRSVQRYILPTTIVVVSVSGYSLYNNVMKINNDTKNNNEYIFKK